MMKTRFFPITVIFAIAMFTGWVFALAFTAPAAAGTTFISGFDDLPLMNGLHEQSDSAVAFDSPQGRIVEVTVWGRVSKREVLKFYNETLAQLGWRQVKAGRYVREGEELNLFFSLPPSGGSAGSLGAGSSAIVRLRFSLAPVP